MNCSDVNPNYLGTQVVQENKNGERHHPVWHLYVTETARPDCHYVSLGFYMIIYYVYN